MQQQDTYNNNIITPSNYYSTGGQPAGSKSKKILLVVAAAAVAIAILVSIIVVTIMNNEPTEPALVNTRENTPTLQLYANLDEEMNLASLRRAVSESGSNASITIEEGGFGTIKIPDSEDAIYFYIDREDEELEPDEIDSDEDDETTVNLLNTYDSVDIVYNIRYAHSFLDDMDMGIVYNEEENTFDVFTSGEGIGFPTKKEAIEAYLSPDANQ